MAIHLSIYPRRPHPPRVPMVFRYRPSIRALRTPVYAPGSPVRFGFEKHAPCRGRTGLGAGRGGHDRNARIAHPQRRSRHPPARPSIERHHPPRGCDSCRRARCGIPKATPPTHPPRGAAPFVAIPPMDKTGQCTWPVARIFFTCRPPDRLSPPPPPRPYRLPMTGCPPPPPPPPYRTRSCPHNTQNRETSRSKGLSRCLLLPATLALTVPPPRGNEKGSLPRRTAVASGERAPSWRGATPRRRRAAAAPHPSRRSFFRLRGCPLHSAWGTATSGEGFRAAQGVRALRQRHCKSTAERWQHACRPAVR